jgi:fibronectin type 3 domain-containing protein
MLKFVEYQSVISLIYNVGLMNYILGGNIVKKRICLSILSLVVIISTLFSSVSFAAVNYSGGLLDGKPVFRGTGPVLHQYKNTTLAITDNNETTYATLERGSESGPELDGMIYDFPTSVKVSGYRLKIDSKTDVKITFYKKDGSSSVLEGTGLVISGALTTINYSNIAKIHLHNSWSATIPKKVYEFNVFGVVEAPPSDLINLAATAGDGIVSLNWNAVSGATSYIIKRSTTPGGPYSTVGSASNNLFEDTNVTNGTTYYYTVTSVNQYGEGMTSNEANASPTVDVPNAPANLVAIGNNELQSIQLNWDTVTGATYYEVKRSTTEGGPYTSIANSVSGTSYTDSDVTPGIIYYYVVTAINESAGSQNSNEASAVLEEIIVEEEGRAILEITMINELVKEYDLSITELNAFLDWYDAKDAGSGPAKYAFTKTWNKGPFKARTEYVIFDKILTFNVDEYDIVNP